MLTFRMRTFLALLAFLIFGLSFVTIGIRWHMYRAKAGIYAEQEMEHTFEAANLNRAARYPGYTPDASTRAARYRAMAATHIRAAEECARLRELYETCW